MNIVQVVMTYLRPSPVCFAPRCKGECVRGAEPSIRILVCPTLNKVQNKNKLRTGSKSNQAIVLIRQLRIIIVVGAVFRRHFKVRAWRQCSHITASCTPIYCSYQAHN